MGMHILAFSYIAEITDTSIDNLPCYVPGSILTIESSLLRPHLRSRCIIRRPPEGRGQFMNVSLSQLEAFTEMNSLTY